MNADLKDLERELWLRKRNSGEIKWKTKEGQEIPIKDMTDQHLINTIKLFERKNDYEDIAMEYQSYMEDLD